MMAEAFASSFGVPVVILRPFNTFGPRQSERAIIAPSYGRRSIHPARRYWSATRQRSSDLTFVNDTAAAFMAAGFAADIEFGQAYNAGSQRAIKISDLINHCSFIQHKPVLQEEKRLRPTNSEVRALLADSTRFVSATGWSPQLKLREGLKRTVDWWRARLSANQVRREKDYIT